MFSDDFTSIRTVADRDNSNIVHWTSTSPRGHYASLERPDVLSAEIREFFSKPEGMSKETTAPFTRRRDA